MCHRIIAGESHVYPDIYKKKLITQSVISKIEWLIDHI
jgi:hypothetical protein